MDYGSFFYPYVIESRTLGTYQGHCGPELFSRVISARVISTNFWPEILDGSFRVLVVSSSLCW